MTYTVLPKIKIEPIKKISPSRYASLKICALRGILSENNVPQFIQSPPAAKIGTIAHSLLQMAVQGQIRDEAEMESKWDLECKNIENKMRENPLESHMIPLSSTFGNYEVKKAMTFNMVRKLLSAHLPVQGSTQTARGPDVEKWCGTADNKVGGFIDLVRKTDSGIEIVDYKTGTIVEDDIDDNNPKQEYQLQLKLYAALFHSENNTWPSRLVLVGLNQKEYLVEFNETECLQLLDDAIKELEEINRKMAAGANPEDFSNPSPESCKYCTYRPVCKPYWRARQDDNKWPTDIMGDVSSKIILGNGLFRIELGVNEYKVAIRGLSLHRYNFLGDDVKKVVFCNLTRDSSDISFTDNVLTAGHPIE